MAKLLNGARQVYEPPGQDDTDAAARVRFFIRTPTVYDRARHARAVARLGARMWHAAALHARAREALAEIFDDAAERGRYEAAIDAVAAASAPGSSPAADLTEEERDALAASAALYQALEDQLLRNDDAYAGMVADRQFWLEVAPIEAFRLFVTGWENLEPGFRAGAEGVHEAVLAALPPELMALAGYHAIALLRPSEAEAKNSASPSGGEPDPAPSPGPSTPAPTDPSAGGGPTAS